MRASNTTRPTPAAVLFDMDGTIVDTERLWLASVERVASAVGRPLRPDDAGHVLGRPSEHTAAHLHRTGGPDVPSPVALAARLDDAFAALVEADIVPRPGALRLLDELAAAGVPTAIVSASQRRVVDLVRTALGRDKFAITIAAEDTVRSKPYPEPYLAAAAALEVSPSACVAIEDSPVGVAAAEAAGCTVIAVPSADPILAAPSRTVVESLEDVDLALLRKLRTRTIR